MYMNIEELITESYLDGVIDEDLKSKFLLP